MAEPVFEDGDPLGEYLKEAGDTMPGHSDPTYSQDVLWSTLVSAFHACLSYLPTDTPLTHEHHASPFAERFKYDIISSSLLATTADFAPLRSGSSLGTPAFPGALGHSRGSSVSQDHQHRGPVEQGQGLVDRRAPRAPAQGHVDVRPLAALGLVLAILTAGYHVLAVLTLLSGGALFLVLNSQASPHPVAEQEPEARQEEDKTTPNMTALHELIVAGSIWDSIVHSTIALLESEESAPSTSFSSPFPSVPPTSMSPSFFHGNNSINGPTSPSKSPTKLSSRLSPASLALRGALQSALSMTHAHCDSVRALLSALTLPGELAQMAEMYAPPSPGPSRFLSARDSPNNLSHVFGGAPGVGRPVSFPGSKLTTPSRDRQRLVKRATWDGHVAAPQNAAVASSPNVTVRKRRAGRRMGEMKSLDLGSSQADRSQGDEAKGDDETPFGPAALGLHRTRKLSGLSQLLSPGFAPSTPPRRAAAAPVTPPSVSSAHAAPYTPYMPRTPFAGGNPAYGGRHHLSLGALHSALAGALASKRFACAHLLALRFDEEDASPPPPAPHSHSSRPHSRRRSRAPGSSQDGREDEEEKEREREAYWEDVRSVMGLLASTLSDTAASLVEALAEAEEQRRRDGNPTPTSEGYRSLPRSLLDPDASFSVVGGSDIGDDVFDSPKGARKRLMLDVLNIDDQGEGEADGFAPAPSRLSRFAAHVGAIQAALDGAKEDLDDCVAAVRQSTAGAGAEAASSGGEDRNAEEEAMLAYERMRRELGLALRECERGREKLAELIATRASSTTDAEEEGEGDGVPELAEDSDRSDKHDSVGVHTRTPTVEFHTDPLIAAPDPHYPDDDGVVPPMGAELVYEAEPEPAVTFNRERSKLTREERIRVAKAKRDSGLGLLDNQETEQNDGSQEGEPWSHGVDVVQELKDVIWQVGERRRRQAEVEL
ncbi:hypothetical protein FIBSPDRAFT_1039422 [Athelia psychrophila]|uniref:Uncharacterized protein n=1 Tax=Athelia psychrophila TaxID=1759441 RepID=A0A166RUL0_9AGAM|nr:hypothetical protein FIBSPDRAFT_1039422 [Fibularhizoctonia sp. CBS 109695]